MAALGFEKASDWVHHFDVFETLMQCHVDANIVAALRLLYRDMSARVVLWQGLDSRRFGVQRSVRQGDLFSPLFFNLVLDQVLRSWCCLAATGLWYKRRPG